jgi:hypothetical protein
MKARGTLTSLVALLVGFAQHSAGQTCVGIQYSPVTETVVPLGSSTIYITAVNYSYNPPPPVSGVALVFFNDGVDGTGGHSHSHDFSDQPAGTVSPSSCTTNGAGQCSVTYNTLYLGQLEILGVQWFDPCQGSEETSLTTDSRVAYSDIVAYSPANPSQVQLVGANSAHPSNHYGTTALTSGVDNAASNWYSTYGSALLVNDMGLPNGGWFDLNSNWSCPHQYHGRGTAVDFNGVNSSSPPSVLQNMQTWCSNAGLSLTYAEATNYHCEVAGDGINRFSSSSCPTTPGAPPPNGVQ